MGNDTRAPLPHVLRMEARQLAEMVGPDPGAQAPIEEFEDWTARVQMAMEFLALFADLDAAALRQAAGGCRRYEAPLHLLLLRMAAGAAEDGS